jgi:hypothetical protein
LLLEFKSVPATQLIKVHKAGAKITKLFLRVLCGFFAFFVVNFGSGFSCLGIRARKHEGEKI